MLTLFLLLEAQYHFTAFFFFFVTWIWGTSSATGIHGRVVLHLLKERDRADEKRAAQTSQGCGLGGQTLLSLNPGIY